MRPMALFLLLIAALFLLGFAVHTLLWVALVALVAWFAVLMVRPPERPARRCDGSPLAMLAGAWAGSGC